jgi:hypothetical protein
VTDRQLYLRGAETLLASWDEHARGATDAAVQRLPGVASAVFPNEPERAVYDNALLDRDLAATERADALDAMEAAYAAAGVTRFAAWVHETDRTMRTDLERRRYTLEETTHAMGMALALDDIRLPRPKIELRSTDREEYLRTFGLPSGLLSGADHTAFHLLVARLDGDNVATAMAFDHDGDCGIYNVAILEQARRHQDAVVSLLIEAAILHCEANLNVDRAEAPQPNSLHVASQPAPAARKKPFADAPLTDLAPSLADVAEVGL